MDIKVWNNPQLDRIQRMPFNKTSKIHALFDANRSLNLTAMPPHFPRLLRRLFMGGNHQDHDMQVWMPAKEGEWYEPL